MQRQRNLVLTPHGWWEWNCGWTLLTPRLRPRPNFRPKTHAEFRAMVKGFNKKVPKKLLKTLSDIKAQKDRIWSDWRRVRLDTMYTHELYGDGVVTDTDGVHCIFEYTEVYNAFSVLETKVTVRKSRKISKLVHITNLTEIKPPSAGGRGGPGRKKLTVEEKTARAHLRAKGKAITPEAVAAIVEILKPEVQYQDLLK